MSTHILLNTEIFYEERGLQYDGAVFDTIQGIYLLGNRNYRYYFITQPFYISYAKKIHKFNIGLTLGANISYRIGGVIQTYLPNTVGYYNSLYQPSYLHPFIDYGGIIGLFSSYPIGQHLELEMELRHYRSLNSIGIVSPETIYKHFGYLIFISANYLFKK